MLSFKPYRTCVPYNSYLELIRGGIDSFKIEGRMKKQEYVAGVTGIYQRRIDSFLSDPENDKGVSKRISICFPLCIFGQEISRLLLPA